MIGFNLACRALLVLVAFSFSPALAAPTGDRITMDEVRALEAKGQRVHYIDSRGKAEGASIPGAVRVTKDSLDVPKAWPRNALIVAYCTWPKENSSARVAQALRAKGYSKVFALVGGLKAWQDHGSAR